MQVSRTDSKVARDALPLGPRVETILELAYRARRPVLLEGGTGIGKSELVVHVAKKLGVQHVVLDLSLLEPPDLVGLPVVEGGRTRYALPHVLPREGRGILMLEELNRAERYIQQPALQLLSARSLHEYVLPEGWACFAAVNPENGEYQVTPLDAALRARFLQLPVRPDRASWLAWAGGQAIHPAVLAVVREHERVFEGAPPRSWTYVSQLLSAMTATELADTALVHDVVSGYLPAVWATALCASKQLTAGALGIDAHAMLCEYAPKGPQAELLRGLKERGEVDKLDELSARLSAVLASPECGVLVEKKQLTMARLEALFADLPGDRREALQAVLGQNPTAIPLLDVRAEQVLLNYGGSAAQTRVNEWKAQPVKHHRVALLATAVRVHVLAPQAATEIRKSNAQRQSLGHFLAQLGERWGLPLAEALHKASITPIRPA
jgi:MoxR-like ATPase